MLMHTTFVIIHISAMIASMVLMVSAVGFGLSGKHIAARIATIGYVTTVGGIAIGGILLLGAPLSIQCALLTAYLLSVTVLYHFGFAFGDAENARLIRTKA